MPPRNIVIGQQVDQQKAAQAREFRHAPTEAEKILWECLRQNRLGGLHFRRQQVIAGYIVDFYCHAAGLAVEVDGPVHEVQVEYDAERARVLAEHQVHVLRIQNHAVIETPDAVLEVILLACQGKG